MKNSQTKRRYTQLNFQLINYTCLALTQGGPCQSSTRFPKRYILGNNEGRHGLRLKDLPLCVSRIVQQFKRRTQRRPLVNKRIVLYHLVKEWHGQGVCRV
jgi:hypothetical protein